jgi:cyclase
VIQKEERMKEIAPGVYVETRYASGNVGIITTGAGVVCVDVPMLPSDAYHWRAQIESVTTEPIVTLVQTDYDQARVVSTYLFDVPLVAHDEMPGRMKMYASEKVLSQINDTLRRDGAERRWRSRLPDITFSERLILYKGDREIHVLHGGGHSPATCMVYLPAESLIFAGDVVFCGMHPTMGLAETKQWLSTLTALRKMSVDVIVPGHGKPCDREATHALSDYIRDMRAMVRRSFQGGRSKSETSSSVIPEMMDAFHYDEGKRDQIRLRIKGGSDRIYDEYRAEAKAGSAKGRGPARRSSSRRRRRRS